MNKVMNWIKFSASTAMLALSVSVFHQPTNAQRPSTFATSCTDISISGAQLSATCIKKNGSNQRTSITIRGIHNRNGQLVQSTIREASTFNRTCTGISISGDQLSASCRTGNGENQQSSVTLLGINNSDGNLTY
ncbi:CVNH domain-containing protein [Pantanalinema rosaneae CENA516]|uniref:CVNH domain-containing protein n=1 Tax=Pantanalinema rosaneae TaxID=1620701 RepID=UPI003D6F865E